jgi:threonine aldolase
LGAPIGSLLLGDREYIKKARRVRKVFGGGMRQAGYIAAAGLYALQHNIDRLAEDHRHAKQIAEALLKKDFIGKMLPVETNILIFEVLDGYTPKEFCEYLKDFDVLCLPISTTHVRMVLHLDVTPKMVENLLHIIYEMP